MTTKTLKRCSTLLLLVGLVLFPDCGWLGDVHVTQTGAANLTSGDNGAGNPITPIPSTAGPALSLNIPSPAVISQCWGGGVSYLNNGQVTAIPLQTTLSLLANGSVTFFSSSNCDPATSISQVSLTAGSSGAAFWMVFGNTGGYSITAQVLTGSTATPSTVPVNVLASAPATVPASLALAGPPQLNAGACSVYTATLLNSSNLPAPFTSTTSLALTGGGASAQYFTDPLCANATNSLQVPAGTAVTSFFFKRTLAGNGAIMGTEGGLTGSLTVLTIQGAPDHLTILGDVVMNNTCNPDPYQIAVRDLYENSTSFTSATNISLSTTGPGNFYLDKNCANQITTVSLPANAVSASVYYKSGFGGTPHFVASVSPIKNGTLDVTIIDKGPGAAAQLAFTAPGSVTTAGTCYGPYSVSVQDNSGRDVTNQSSYNILLAQTGNAAFYSDPACGNAITSTAPKTSIFVADNRAESLSLTATDSAHALGQATQGLQVNAGAPSQLLLVSADSSFAAGKCESFLVAFTDFYGNATPLTNAAPVYFTQTGAPMGTFYSDNSCATALPTAGPSNLPSLTIAAASYQHMLYYKATQIGGGIATASSPSVNNANLSFTVIPGAPASVVLLSQPTTIVVGACSAPFVFELLDQYKNPTTASVNTSFTITDNQGSFFTSSTCTGTATTTLNFPTGTGQSTLYFTPTTTTGVNVVVSCSGYPNYNFSFTVSSGGPTNLVLNGASPLSSKSPGQGIVGQCYPFLVSVQDGFNNSVTSTTAIPVTFTTSGPGTSTLYSDLNCATATTTATIAAQANSTVIYYSGTGAGDTIITANATGLNKSTYDISLSAGPAKTLVVSGPTTGIANTCVGPFQITSTDAYGNPTAAPGSTVNLSGGGKGLFYKDVACGTSLTSIAMTAPYVSAPFYFDDLTAETLTFTAAASNLTSGTHGIVIGAGTPYALLFSGPTKTGINQCGGPITFQVIDYYGNVIVDPTNDRVFTLAVQGGISISGTSCSGGPITTITLHHGQTTSDPLTFSSTVILTSVISLVQTSPSNPAATGTITIATSSPMAQITSFTLNGIAETSITVNSTQTVTAAWTAINVGNCQVNPGQVSGASGTCALNNLSPNKTYNYSLDCTGLNGATGVSQAFTITVTAPTCVTKTINDIQIPATARPVMDYGWGYLSCMVNGVLTSDQNAVAPNKSPKYPCHFDKWGYRNGNQSDKSVDTSRAGNTPPVFISNVTAGQVLYAESITGTAYYNNSCSNSCSKQCGSSDATGMPTLQFVDAHGNVVGIQPRNSSQASNGLNAIPAYTLLTSYIVVPSGAVGMYGSWPDGDYSDNHGGCNLSLSLTTGPSCLPTH